MKINLAGMDRWFCLGSLALMFTAWQAQALSFTRSVMVKTDPAGATVKVDGVAGPSATPVEIKVKWDSSSASKPEDRVFTIDLPGYQTETFRVGNVEAKQAKSSVPILKEYTLKPLTIVVRAQFVVEPAEAKVKLPGQEVKAGDKCEIKFNRPNGDAPWEPVEAVISANNYASKTVVLKYETLKADPAISASLELIRKEITLELKSSEADSVVEVNGKAEANTPFKRKFVFDKVAGKWSSFEITISKEGFRQKLPPGQGKPGHLLPMSVTLKMDSPELKTGEITALLEKVQFIPTPVYSLQFDDKGPKIVSTNELSEIGKSAEPQKMEKFTDFKIAELMETRLCSLPDGRQIALSLPRGKLPFLTEPVSLTSLPNFSMNIWIHKGGPMERVTDGPYLDIEPSVDRNGEWIYFASNRLNRNRFNIWRVRIDGKGGFLKVTDSPSSLYDHEPAVSPDAKKLLFVSFQAGMSSPQIWVCNSDGTAQTLLRSGSNPSWSSDGTRIAFIAADDDGRNQVWVMNADGSSPAKLTSSECQNRHPVWVPGDKELVFCSDQAISQENVTNWDIWKMDVGGSSKVQLTTSGSYDDQPAISPDGNFIYFLTNRSAQKKGEPFLQIWRMEMGTKQP